MKKPIGGLCVFIFVFFTVIFSVSAQGTFSKFPGFAIDIAIGGNRIWAVGGDKGVWYWAGSEWVRVESKDIARVAVDPQGNPWVVDNSGSIFRWVNNQWQKITGQAIDIGIGADGSVYSVGWGNKLLFKYTGIGSTGWSAGFGSDATQVAVDPQGNPWVVESTGKIAIYSGTKRIIVPGRAVDIAISANGTVYVVGDNEKAIYRFTGTGTEGKEWDFIGDVNKGFRIAADAQGVPYVVARDEQIFRR